IMIGTLAIEVRASSLPTEYGETIVLRILNPKSLVSLQGLGLREDLLKLFRQEIKKPNGMIIVTGPTGSGKTTTLYAFLKEIQNPKIKIITIEDPIEYHLTGISQTQTAQEKGYDFASGLRSIVRQDPDVILVGEIRDLETADIGLQAALTGHLVLTTLHTNDAAGTVARLVNLGVKPADIGPALNIAIAQRLVRKVCSKCATFKKPSSEELNKIKKELKNISKKIKNPKRLPSLQLHGLSGENRSF
ncbi:MAG: Flp pilus assembly complex ATPase component TadA, partial [Candidatus Nealsonbacteria bacterium]|nr:Flp pilus assembly complex ATPase component TadA [Candidatus Nealsonbacteria bacterium]